MPLKDFYAGKKVFVTGHGGFKGGWLVMLLKVLGAKVYGYSLLPESTPRLYDLVSIPELLEGECIADTYDSDKLKRFMGQYRPEIVFHLAAQPLVIESYLDPVTTYRTNVLGTLNVLEACRSVSSVKAVVNVTTDKCYENRDDGRPFKEGDPLGGYDMYSSSKACSEILSASYRNAFLKTGKPFALATARAGNVIGGGDFSKNRILPDCVRALVSNMELQVRSPEAVRPWQHVLEALYGYLRLAQALYTGEQECEGAFNFGPDNQASLTVGELVNSFYAVWGKDSAFKTQKTCFHEASCLRLDTAKAQQVLGVVPVLEVKQAVTLTAAWYQAWFKRNENLQKLSLRQIGEFLSLVERKG